MYDRRSKAERTDDLTDKKELRRKLKARSAALTAEYRQAADASIRETVLASALWREAESVFLYVSMWAEPDTYSLLSAALRDGKRVYVPLCCPDAVMQAVRIRRLDELRPGTLNIPEPVDVSETAAPGEIDLAIVPCLAAAKDGRRIGHGAGYYDRFLCRHGCTTLCLCHEAMLTDEIPMGAHDVWMDCVVTEKGLYRGPHAVP